MKRIISTAALLLLLHLSAHADAFRDSISVLLLSDIDSTVIAQFEQKLFDQLAGTPDQRSAEVMTAFLHSQECKDAIIDMYEPYCRLYLTQSEVDDILNWWRTSTIAQGKFEVDLDKINNDPKYNQLIKVSSDNLHNYIQRGKRASAIAAARYIVPNGYRSDFNLMIHNNREYLDLVSQPLINKLLETKQLTAEDCNRMAVKEFVSALSHECILAFFYNTFSAEELRLYVEGIKSQPYRKYEYALQKAKDQNGLNSLQLLGALSAYLMRYEPELAKQLNDALASAASTPEPEDNSLTPTNNQQ